MNPLIDYHQEYLAILEEIDATGGEVTETHEMRLETIAREISQHADKADFVFRKLDAESEFYAAEIKRLQAFKRSIDNTNNRIRESIKAAMSASGITRVFGSTVDILLSGGRQKVVVDEEKLSRDYFDTETIYKVVYKLNRERVAEDLRLGPVEGAHFEDVYSLRITRSKK